MLSENDDHDDTSVFTVGRWVLLAILIPWTLYTGPAFVWWTASYCYFSLFEPSASRFRGDPNIGWGILVTAAISNIAVMFLWLCLLFGRPLTAAICRIEQIVEADHQRAGTEVRR